MLFCWGCVMLRKRMSQALDVLLWSMSHSWADSNPIAGLWIESGGRMMGFFVWGANIELSMIMKDWLRSMRSIISYLSLCIHTGNIIYTSSDRGLLPGMRHATKENLPRMQYLITGFESKLGRANSGSLSQNGERRYNDEVLCWTASIRTRNSYHKR